MYNELCPGAIGRSCRSGKPESPVFVSHEDGELSEHRCSPIGVDVIHVEKLRKGVQYNGVERQAGAANGAELDGLYAELRP